MSKQILPKPLLGRVAQRFKILSEPSRLELLNLLVVNEQMNVMQLVEATGQRQANVSKHLNLMAREGILTRKKEGLNVYYRVSDPTIHGICMIVCERLKEEMDIQQEAFGDI